MSREVLVAMREDGRRARFRLEVFQEGDHWTSTLARLDERGQPETARVAPRFYGLTADQARRRMVSVLENDWDEVRAEDR